MYIHVYNQKRAITFSRKEMERLNQLIYLHHVNINTFAGVAFNQQSQLVSLWSFCVRGSLDDIIFSSDRELGRNFQATFIKHILNGVQYIHQSSIKAHGALFLSNCVVDGYWVVKLTDFGLKGILHNKMVHKDLIAGSYDSLEDLPRCYLQYPPEYLETIKKHKDVYAIEPTVHGDIYQIGMLIYQILFVRRPFCERRESVEEIIDLVTSSSSPFHPVLPEKSPDLTLRLVSIIQQCWLVKTSARPALFKIIDAIAREFGKQGGTLIDQLIKMVDEYSDNLEQIVAERISRIEEERFRTQQILHQVMPREVAEALCDGQQLKPRLHPSVTILMVDVCQFSELCESCIPVHVLEILQQLYSSFDQIILKFKAFKVENVGDAYLVVSGIPDLPDNLHLTEICRISLELKKFMKTLVVLHRPDYTLRVKMGISYGAVAAGVLGLTAPRFCVFGESVNMACRMAGTGVPSKIQVSENASELIQRDFPEFRVEERGTVILKGKGPVTTFWLLDNTEDATPMDPHNVN
ncbi:unnamed protein product [Auanema sp. JU1783]|nr:unnamed protein product [Auanema sp. JU1783]